MDTTPPYPVTAEDEAQLAVLLLLGSAGHKDPAAGGLAAAARIIAAGWLPGSALTLEYGYALAPGGDAITSPTAGKKWHSHRLGAELAQLPDSRTADTIIIQRWVSAPISSPAE